MAATGRNGSASATSATAWAPVSRSRCPKGFTVSGGGDYRWTNYEPGWFPHVPDNGARKDETWSARASVYNRGFTLMGFSPELGVVHEVRNTNAQLYDYERTSGELRFVRQF